MSLHNTFIFSKLDIQRVYLRIDVVPEDIPKTAVCTPFGLFEFLKMPFGLKNTGSTFQRYMDTILANVENVFIYLGDILTASTTAEQHSADLTKVFSLLAQHNLRISIEKCEWIFQIFTYTPRLWGELWWYQTSFSFCVDTISKYPLPTNSFELRRFMGMLNFFRQMIPNFANAAFQLSPYFSVWILLLNNYLGQRVPQPLLMIWKKHWHLVLL